MINRELGIFVYMYTVLCVLGCPGLKHLPSLWTL